MCVFGVKYRNVTVLKPPFLMLRRYRVHLFKQFIQIPVHDHVQVKGPHTPRPPPEKYHDTSGRSGKP